MNMMDIVKNAKALKDQDRQRKARMLEAENRGHDFGPQAEQEGYDRAKSYDPGEAFQRYTTGAISRSNQQLSDRLEELAFDSAGAGRLNTGLFDRDRGDVARRVFQSQNEDFSDRALAVSGMEQEQGQFLAGFGADANNRYLDVLYSNADQARADRQEAAQRKASKGGFLKTLGSIAGGIGGSFLGPAGSAFGARLGANLAGRASGK